MPGQKLYVRKVPMLGALCIVVSVSAYDHEMIFVWAWAGPRILLVQGLGAEDAQHLLVSLCLEIGSKEFRCRV